MDRLQLAQREKILYNNDKIYYIYSDLIISFALNGRCEVSDRFEGRRALDGFNNERNCVNR